MNAKSTVKLNVQNKSQTLNFTLIFREIKDIHQMLTVD